MGDPEMRKKFALVIHSAREQITGQVDLLRCSPCEILLYDPLLHAILQVVALENVDNFISKIFSMGLDILCRQYLQLYFGGDEMMLQEALKLVVEDMKENANKRTIVKNQRLPNGDYRLVWSDGEEEIIKK
jgi:hypothetical protein